MGIKDPCNICGKPVTNRHKALCCDICSKWVHIKCNSISKTEYEEFKNGKKQHDDWFCLKCVNEIMPQLTSVFTDGDTVNDNESSSTTTPGVPVPNNLLPTSNICKYYDASELRQINTRNTISLLHSNIASLNLHFDELNCLLQQTGVNFDIIGITETKIKTTNLSRDIILEGYKYHHTPCTSNCGGALLYIRKSMNYFVREDLETKMSKKRPSGVKLC